MKKLIVPFLLLIIVCLLVVIIYLVQNEKITELENAIETENTEEISSSLVETISDTEDEDDLEADIIANSGISKEDAITIALEDAKADRDNLVFLNSYIKKYNGHFSYNVEFKTGNDYTQYDYIINAMTGEIDLSEEH